jgi:hypothetical protein
MCYILIIIKSSDISREKGRRDIELDAPHYFPQFYSRRFIENLIQLQGMFENEIRIPSEDVSSLINQSQLLNFLFPSHILPEYIQGE